MRKNHRVRIGYYSQHSAEQLELNKSPAEYLVSKVIVLFCPFFRARTVWPHFFRKFLKSQQNAWLFSLTQIFFVLGSKIEHLKNSIEFKYSIEKFACPTKIVIRSINIEILVNIRKQKWTLKVITFNSFRPFIFTVQT